MYKGYKIIVNTAAGRRRYMQYLIPQVLSNEIVDRYDIWVNTNDRCDIEFFVRLSKRFEKIHLIYQPDGIVNGIASINAFYRFCVEEDAIYIKMDDDVVWLEPDYVRKMVDFRLDNKNCFLVSPLVINNALSTYVLQTKGKIKLNKYMYSRCSHRILWERGSFAVQLHNWFLEKYLKTGKYERLYCEEVPWALTRFSINSIIWFGTDMKAINGEIMGDDEEYLSCIRPTQIGKCNLINGNCIIAHFAFAPQRRMLDECMILEQYGDYLCKFWKADPILNSLNEEVQSIMRDVNERREKIMKEEPLYKQVDNNSLSKKIKKKIKDFINYEVDKHRTVKYIVE